MSEHKTSKLWSRCALAAAVPKISRVDLLFKKKLDAKTTRHKFVFDFVSYTVYHDNTFICYIFYAQQ